MSNSTTLSQLIESLKSEYSTGIHFVKNEKEDEFISYSGLYYKATKVLGLLQRKGLHKGDKLVFQFEENKHFVLVFWACILGGIIPIPLALAAQPSQKEKVVNAINLLNNPFVITDSPLNANSVGFPESEIAHPFSIIKIDGSIEEILNPDKCPDGNPADIEPDDIAFIQFSSGSTSSPKGVILTHRNLICNIKAITNNAQCQNSDSSLSWMPLTHDMGLIGFHLSPIAISAMQYLMPTALFIRYPILWLKKVAEYKITTTASPNFGLRYFIDHFRRKPLKGLQLDSLKLLYNGAEPISKDITEEFLELLAPYGLKKEAIHPVYGLAEASLIVSAPQLNEGIKYYSLRRDSLRMGDEIRFDSNGVTLVDLGYPVEGVQIRLVDNEDRLLSENHVGNIEIFGENVTEGYYNNAAATKETIKADGWLRTGDIGVMLGGRLLVTGRKKDLLFVNGQNFYSHDLENIADETEGLGSGKVVAISASLNNNSEENIVFFVRFEQDELTNFIPVMNTLKLNIYQKLGLNIKYIIPVKKVPETASGKVQRYKLKEQFEAGEFNEKIQKIEDLQNIENENSNIMHTLSPTEKQLLEISQEIIGNKKIGIHDHFFEIGVSSLQLAQIHQKVEAVMPGKLTITDFFAYPSVAKLSSFIEQKYRQETDQIAACNEPLYQPCANNETEDKPQYADKKLFEPIAIIGMAGKFPKADNLSEFWDNLKSGRDCIGEYPEERRSMDNDFLFFVNRDDEMNRYIPAGYMNDVAQFDYDYFHISPKEASLMDPDQRLFLTVAIEAIENAGYGGDNLKGSNTGVFVGHIAEDSVYKQIVSEVIQEHKEFALLGNLSSLIASRLSYFLDLKGPSIVIDTACSSSLVAIHNACSSIHRGDCEMAIVGAVRTLILPTVNYIKLGIESPEGKSKAFSENADGTGVGEGVGVVVLKKLSAAQRDRDHILAVISGSAVNQDGKSIGITAPNVLSQENVITRAWESAMADPSTISYIETHGTGTKLGDFIEIEGIRRAFSHYTDKKQFCALESAKSNIGHLYAASGIAGLIKAIYCLQNKLLVKSLHCDQSIVPDDSPIYVNNKLTEWKSDVGPLRCGISSFGFNGTNCHIVLEEAPQFNLHNNNDNKNKMYIFSLSAKNKKSLESYLENFCSFLGNETSHSIGDICYSINTGRGQYRYRIAFIINNLEEAIEKIAAVIDKGFDASLTGVYCSNNLKVNGHASNNHLNNDFSPMSKETLSKIIEEYADSRFANGFLAETICKIYVLGNDIDWSMLYKTYEFRKVALPTYPFDAKHTWVEIPRKKKQNELSHPVFQLLACGQPPKELIQELDALYQKFQVNLSPANKTENKVALSGKPSQTYSDTGKIIGEIWAKELGYSSINVNDNFLDLGGDSIFAVGIVNELASRLNIKVNIRDILEYPILGEFTEYIEKTYKLDKSGTYSFLIDSLEEKEYYQTSSAQKRLYILNEFENAELNYNMPFSLMIEGHIDFDQFEKTFKKLIQRHEILRTTFHFIEGTPVQKIHDTTLFSIEKVKASKEFLQQTIEEFIRPFDLSSYPLIRAAFIQIEENRHVLLMDMHHIIADGTSMGIILRDFAYLYSGQELPELKFHYKDFADWQNKFLQQDAMKKQKEYWISLFSDTIPVLNLHTDFNRPLIQTFKGERVDFSIDQELTLQLKNIAKQLDATYFMTLLSVYTILLAKYTLQDDIVIGTPISGRQYPGVENIVGMFVNMLPIRNYPDAEKQFNAFLKEVKQNVLQAFENQDYQFEELVEELSPKRELGRNPIFDVVFVLQNQELFDIQIDGLTFSSFKTENITSKFDLLLEAIEKGGKTYFSFEYNTALFKRTTIERLAGHFINCIKNIIQNISVYILDIDLLTEKEKRLHLQYESDIYYPQTTIQILFEKQAELNPDKKAITLDTEYISYSDLNKKSNKLAHFLRKKGVKPNSIVGIISDRSIEMIIGILAVVKAGGGYLPIDPDYPDDRINYMLSDSQAPFLLAQKGYSDKLNYPYAMIYFEDRSLWQNEPSENITCINKPDDLLYIIYTSGTTGEPKGTMIEHRNVVQLLFNDQFLFHFDCNDTWTMFHSFCFDFSVWEIYGALLYGGQLVIIPKIAARDYRRFLALLKEKKVTVLNQTPVAFYNLIQEEIKEPDKELKLRYVIFGGEVLKPVKLKEWHEKYPETELINMYGITETTVHVTYKKITQHEIDNNISNIGMPLPAYNCYVMDKNQKLVPFGVPGELYVGGAGVARGYLNRAKLTSEKFIINPYKQNERLYRSGDLVIKTEDHEMIYLGRIDHQIKIRGFRIELGEIESRLLNHPSIKEAIVRVKEIKQDQKALVAYLIPQSAGSDEQLPIYESLEQTQVHNWEQVFEENYKKHTDQQDLTFNINGWISSYTNSQIPAAEMKEWLDGTVERILSQKPNHVLEIGCGTGMLLFRVAPSCKNYIGIDLSYKAIQYVRFVTKKLNLNLMNVQLHNAAASDLDNLELPPVDTVVINSVIQYFPDHHYLLRILDKIIALLSNRESTIFLGDIRNLALVENFHASVVFQQEKEFAPAENTYKKIRQSVSQDFELSIDPIFFYKLKDLYPQITDVEIHYKKATYFNEMSAFRYDVLIHVNKACKTIQYKQMVWEKEISIDHIVRSILNDKLEALEIINIPHQWLYKTSQTIEMLITKKDIQNINEAILQLPENASMLPEHFLSKCPDGYTCEILWDGPEKDIFFRVRYIMLSESVNEKHVAFPVFDTTNYSYKEFGEYCSHPLKKRINQQITKDIKEFLKQQLPEYMIPDYFIIMDSIPLTNNGKVNNLALPSPEIQVSVSGGHFISEPANEAEKAIKDIWTGILNINDISIHDNFFNLGGNSLTAIQMLYQLQENFVVSTNDVFLYPTIAELASHITFKKDNLKSKITKAIDFYKDYSAKEEWVKNQLSDPFASYVSHYREEIDTIDLCKTNSYKNILLTGATGYLGVHVLIELLISYQETVFVIIRGKNSEDALERLKCKLGFYSSNHFYEKCKSRIKVICGDITSENFGTDPATYEYLAENIDCIINAAANVKHFGNYEDFYISNVKSVERLIHFTKAKKSKRIFHISSSGVAYGKVQEKEAVLFTEYDSDVEQKIDNFYMQSKMEAEQLVLKSKEEGLDASIIRVGNLTFHSQTGHFQENIQENGFYKLIASLLKLNIIPDIPLKVFDLSFIDKVSKAVALLIHCPLKAETYHVFNPYRLSYPELAALLNDTGYSIKTKNVESFFDFINEHYQNKEMRPWIDNILLHSYLFENIQNTYFEFAGNRTMLILEKLGFYWDKVTQEHIDKMIQYGKEKNFFVNSL